VEPEEVRACPVEPAPRGPLPDSRPVPDRPWAKEVGLRVQVLRRWVGSVAASSPENAFACESACIAAYWEWHPNNVASECK
jgi:hypothetical protein